jgi:hypothetical protein
MAQSPLDSGLVAYYPFNGNARDESGHGNHGFVHGATLTGDRSGKFQSAYSFDGKDDYIRIPFSSDFDFSEEMQVSFGCWAFARSTEGEPVFLNKPTNCTYFGYSLTLETAGHFRARVMASRCVIDTHTPEAIPLYEWHHVFATVDSNFLKLYIDGKKVDEKLLYDSKLHKTIMGDTYIGAEAFGDGSRALLYQDFMFFADAFIDEVRIYNLTLNDSEVRLLYEMEH